MHTIMLGLVLGSLLACTTSTDRATIRLNLDSAQVDVVHTLTVTMRDATTSAGQSVAGELSITTRRQRELVQQQVRIRGSIMPNWLLPFNGTLNTIITPTQTWQYDDGCVRDGSMLPPVSMRDILGPMSGFYQNGAHLTSETGGAAWQQFSAHAERDAQGQLISMTGRGRGKILLPGGEVVTGDMDWQYQTRHDTTVIVLPPRCSDAVYAEIPLPAHWQNRRPYGGAILAESTTSLATAAPELVTFLATNGWQSDVIQSDTQGVVIQAASQQDTIRLFLVANQQNGVDLTIIVQP
jgi:hypothetical protein